MSDPQEALRNPEVTVLREIVRQREDEIARLRDVLLEIETGHFNNYRTLAHNALKPPKTAQPETLL